MNYEPPLSITPEILNAVARISEQVGAMGHERWGNQPQLRRQNRIKTIAGTLAIEGNTLSEEQVTAILDGGRGRSYKMIFLVFQRLERMFQGVGIRAVIVPRSGNTGGMLRRIASLRPAVRVSMVEKKMMGAGFLLRQGYGGHGSLLRI